VSYNRRDGSFGNNASSFTKLYLQASERDYQKHHPGAMSIVSEVRDLTILNFVTVFDVSRNSLSFISLYYTPFRQNLFDIFIIVRQKSQNNHDFLNKVITVLQKYKFLLKAINPAKFS